MTDDRPAWISDSPDRTVALARRLAGSLSVGDVVALVGELGAGKTQFVRGLVEGLGGDGRAVSSPTFVLMQEYDTTPPLIHIDAYRLNDLAEVRELGWTEPLIGESITVIEWADRIQPELPDGRITIRLDHVGPTQRRITVGGAGRVGRDVERCPICRSPVRPGDADFPFCSERCRMVDLGRWFDGDYRVSRELRPDSEDDMQLYDEA
jgi:tRNA threonylcarbamoyladenosine biosynthesis protein TsaE